MDDAAEVGPCAAELDHLIRSARAGSVEDRGKLLEQLRPYLLWIAADRFPNALGAKVGASDLVQETLLRADRHFAEFKGVGEPELRGWLRQILLNQMAETARKFQRQKRRAGREQSLDGDLVGRQPSPSWEFMAREEQDRLERALARLSEDYRRVIMLRHRENLPFAEIGRILARSEKAANELWARAVRALRKEMRADDSGSR